MVSYGDSQIPNGLKHDRFTFPMRLTWQGKKEKKQPNNIWFLHNDSDGGLIKGKKQHKVSQ